MKHKYQCGSLVFTQVSEGNTMYECHKPEYMLNIFILLLLGAIQIE